MELSLHSNDPKKKKKKQLRLSFYMQSGLKKAKMVKSDEKIMTMIFFFFLEGGIYTESPTLTLTKRATMNGMNLLDWISRKKSPHLLKNIKIIHRCNFIGQINEWKFNCYCIHCSHQNTEIFLCFQRWRNGSPGKDKCWNCLFSEASEISLLKNL